MKQSFLFVIGFCIFFQPDAYSRSDNELFDIINKSFMEYVKVDKSYSRYTAIDDPADPYKNVFIELQYLPRGFEFSQEVWNLNFRGVYTNFLNSRGKKVMRKPRTVIFPTVELNGDEIEVRFSVRVIQYKKGVVRHTVGSFWVSSYWKYSNESDKWEFIKSEGGGI